MYYIYTITNEITNKKYVGFSNDYQERWRTHVSDATRDEPTRKILYLSIRKHGIENFKFDVVYCSEDKTYTKNEIEPHFIREYNTLAPYGYNMTKGGDGGPGVTSEQAIAFNNKRLEDGSHVFLKKEFQDGVSKRMKDNNPMKNPEISRKVAESTSIRMAIMKSRPIITEVRGLFIKAGEKIPRGLHLSSDDKLLAHAVRLKQNIANLQVVDFNFFSAI